MSDLAAFLLARLAEDEADWWAVDRRDVEEQLHGKPIARKMLADCTAKRLIVIRHRDNGLGWCDDDTAHFPCKTLRLLALPYADHSDFDTSWDFGGS